MKDIDFLGLASLAAARLEEELSREVCDTKKARDFSAVVKESMNLHKDFDAWKEKEIRIVFEGDTEAASK